MRLLHLVTKKSLLILTRDYGKLGTSILGCKGCSVIGRCPRSMGTVLERALHLSASYRPSRLKYMRTQLEQVYALEQEGKGAITLGYKEELACTDQRLWEPVYLGAKGDPSSSVDVQVVWEQS